MPYPIWDGDDPEPSDYIYICVPVPNTRTHRQAFQSQIHDLTWWNMYQRTDDKAGQYFARAFERTRESVDRQLLEQPDECGDEELDRCYTFGASWTGITWYPRSPYEEFVSEVDPLNVPIWLVNEISTPPFLQDILDFLNNRFGFDPAGQLQEIAGIEYGDVLTTLYNITSLEFLPQNTPGFSFSVTSDGGVGHIDLHFVTLPLGGRIAVTVNNDPWGNLFSLNPSDWLARIDDILGSDANSELLEMNRDIVSIPPETEADLIHRIYITEPGEHTIYARWLPVVNDSIDFLNFGGGFRYVEICGLSVSSDYSSEEMIMTTPKELSDAFYDALRRDRCGCCGDGTGGADDNFVDQDNDNIDDVTGEFIPTSAELRSSSAELSAQEWLEFAYFVMTLNIDGLSINTVESLIDLEYDVIDALSLANQLSGADAAEDAAGRNILDVSESLFGATVSTARNGFVADLAERIFCGGNSRTEFGRFSVDRFNAVVMSEATLELLKLIKASPTDALIASWGDTDVPSERYLSYDCTIRPILRYTLTASEYFSQSIIPLNLSWNDFSQPDRRIAVTARGAFVGQNSSGDTVERDFFFLRTVDANGAETIQSAPLGTVFLEGATSAGGDNSTINYSSRNFAATHIYRNIANLSRAAARAWKWNTVNAAQTAFAAQPTGEISITITDLGIYD